MYLFAVRRWSSLTSSSTWSWRSRKPVSTFDCRQFSPAFAVGLPACCWLEILPPDLRWDFGCWRYDLSCYHIHWESWCIRLHFGTWYICGTRKENVVCGWAQLYFSGMLSVSLNYFPRVQESFSDAVFFIVLSVKPLRSLILCLKCVGLVLRHWAFLMGPSFTSAAPNIFISLFLMHPINKDNIILSR